MCFSTDSNCTSLKFPSMVPRTLKPLCQGTSVAAPVKRNYDKSKNIVDLLMMKNSLALAAWLVSGKPICVKEFQKTLLTLS